LGGKGGGTCYLVDSNNMPAGGISESGIPQSWHCVDPTNVRPTQTHHLHNSTVWWDGVRLLQADAAGLIKPGGGSPRPLTADSQAGR
jgi:hypothetical protein